MGSVIYVDLCDRAGHFVKITPDRVSIQRHDCDSEWFLRHANMLAQVKPEPGGSINDLRPFLNLRSETQFILVVAFILGAMYPDGSFPILNVCGPQGAAKSTLFRCIRSIVDPSIAPLTSAPKSKEDLFITASHGWLHCFDNMSNLSHLMSDACCEVSSGGAIRKRVLYTNDEEFIIEAKNPLAFNGIAPFAEQNDFLDRSISIELAPISHGNRMTEGKFWAEWEKARPKILGAFYSALAMALKNVDQVKLDSLPRMADFARWVVASEPACPWENGRFLKAYENNRCEMVDMAIEGDPVAEAVLKLLDGQNKWEGTASELLRYFNEKYEEISKKPKWPKTPIVLSNRLMRLEGFLAVKGITIERRRTQDKRLIILSKTEENVAAVDAHKPARPQEPVAVTRESVSSETMEMGA